MAGPIQVAGIPDTKAALISLCEAGQWAQASNLVSDARRASADAVRLSAVLDEVWAERGPTGDARGWPVALDTPIPVDVPQRADRQTDDRWGAVA
jgi:hypothetical protein